MDLISDIVQDFVNRSRDELDLVEHGLATWQLAPTDPNKLTPLDELLQSLREMSGLLGLPELESLFHDSHAQLLVIRHRWPQPCLEVIAELQDLINDGRRLLCEMEFRPNDATSTNRISVAINPPLAHLIQTGGPPTPFRRRESLRGPANSLTDFIVENLTDAEQGAEGDSNQIGVRLIRLIDEVMSARNQIRQIFERAVSLTSEQERSTFLEATCAGCPELRSSLERVLNSESQSQRLLLFPASELIRALLDSLRSEMLQPEWQTPPMEHAVPDASLSEKELASTIQASPSSTGTSPTVGEAIAKSKTFPHPFGRYTLERELGHGAMGTVFLASDRLLNRQVALKVLRVKPEDGHDIVERFYREARSMASLQHANLCPIYDFGEINGQPFLTMAFIKGRPLSDYLTGGRRLVTRYAVMLARTLATALHQAHERGIVHRDLKPGNVMINHEAEPILMDFGLARRYQPGEEEITQQGVILGSPAYMSPEQVEGNNDQIGPATDLHALGVMLYEMLGGKRPFEGSFTSVLTQILTKEAEPLDIPGDPEHRLDAICRRAMSKAISDRYASALDFANALTEYLDSANRVRLAPEVDLTPQDEHEERSSVGEIAIRTTQIWIHPERRRRRWRWAAISVALIGITIMTIKLSSRSEAENIPLKVGSTNTLHESR